MTEKFLWEGKPESGPVVVLAHGAGASMNSPFMAAFAQGLAGAGIPTARFEFPYMRRRRAEGTKRPPDRPAVLIDSWRAVIAALVTQGVARQAIVIGGKSMGGRIASMVADEEGVLGLVCLGYPFHPPGRPEKTRVEHLAALSTPGLIVQGTRDSLGSKEDVAGYKLAQTIAVRWMEDGDHSFKPRKASGRTEGENWREGIELVADWVKQRAEPK